MQKRDYNKSRIREKKKLREVNENEK